MACILVTGVGGPAGRNTARLLMDRGHSLVVTDVREVDSPGMQFRPVPPANDRRFLDELCRISVQAGVQLVVPTVSEELPVIAAALERWGGIPVVIAPCDAVLTANDKYLTCQRLLAAEVAVPRFALASEVHCLKDVADKVGWPCVSKPRVGRGGRQVAVHDEDDWESIACLDEGYILQEFASGTDYAPNLYVPRSGEAVAIVLEKTKLKEGIVGNALEVRRVEVPDVAALALNAARALGFHGPLDVDVRRRSDGVPVVLEINARFGANVAHSPEVLDAMLQDFGFA